MAKKPMPAASGISVAEAGRARPAETLGQQLANVPAPSPASPPTLGATHAQELGESAGVPADAGRSLPADQTHAQLTGRTAGAQTGALAKAQADGAAAVAPRDGMSPPASSEQAVDPGGYDPPPSPESDLRSGTSTEFFSVLKGS
jgi:hypothetical protein